MRPLFTVTLTILGTVLAGIPLFYLTAETPHQYEQADPTYDEPIKETVSVTVEFSGSPLSCIIRSTSTGAELAAMPEQTKSPWVVELSLPQQDLLDLEVETHWPDAESKYAVEITLTPPQKKECSCTRWTDEGDNILHDIFEFQW